MKKQLKLLFVLLALCFALAGLVACNGSQNVTVTFDANFDGKTFAVTLPKGSQINAPLSPSRDGYVFEGWTADKEGVNPFDFKATKADADIVIYAKWSVEPTRAAVVTFKVEGMADKKITILKGTKTTEPVLPESEKYDTVWYYGQIPFDFDTAIDSDVVLTARRAIKTYTVTVLNYDGNVFDTMTVNYGDNLTKEQVEDAIGLPYHRYDDFYTLEGLDGDINNIVKDVVLVPRYEYRCLPLSLFDFVKLNDDTYGIKAYKNTDFRHLNLEGAYGLPSKYNGVPVSRILQEGLTNAYGSFKNITALYIPASYKVLENNALSGVYADKIIADGIEEIWAQAFNGCAAATELPATVKYIEPLAFVGYGNIKGEGYQQKAQMTISENNPYFKTTGADDDLLVTADGKTLVAWLNYTPKQHLVVPSGIDTIYAGLCINAYSLQSVIFEGDVKTIGAGAFYRLNMLQSVTFKGKVQRIEGIEANIPNKGNLPDSNTPKAGAFESCFRLGITLPKGLKFIGDYAFADTSLKEIILDGIEHIGKDAFFCNRFNLSKIVVTNSQRYYSHEDKALIERGTGAEYNGKKGDTFLLYAGVIEGWLEEKKFLNADEYLVDTYTLPQGVTALAKNSMVCAHYIKHLVIPEGVRELPAGAINSNAAVSYYNPEDGTQTQYNFGIIDISLPSTLESLSSKDYDTWRYSNTTYPCLTVGKNFAGFLWPNGCNLKKIEYWAFVPSSGMTSFTLPKSVTEYQPLGYHGLHSTEILVEEGNPKYISFGGWLFEKLGGKELKLIQIPKSYPTTDGKIVFPDTGEYKVTIIGKDAAYGMSSYYKDGQMVNPETTHLVLPEGVKIIEKEAFSNASRFTEITFPSTLEYIGDNAFAMVYKAKKLTFLGEVPPVMGKNIFDSFFEAPLTGATIHIPNGKFFNWYDYLKNYSAKYGSSYLKALETPTTYTYRFETNGGSAVEDIQAYYLWDIPASWWDGEGKKYFWGFYTADGADGEWGQKALSFENGYIDEPFKGDAIEGVVTLYARFENVRFEDGKDVESAYYVAEQSRAIAIDKWETKIFEFTPAKDGLYLLKFDYDKISWSDSGFGKYDRDSDTINMFFDVAVEDEETYETLYYGFPCKAGETYYIVYWFFDQNAYTGEINMPTATIDFSVEWQGEIPDWWTEEEEEELYTSETIVPFTLCDVKRKEKE